MKRITLLFAFLMMSMGMVLAQSQVEVSGTVISAEDNQPIIGATVRGKTSKKGDRTNIDGKFKFTVPANEKIIVVSFVGMRTQEVTIGKGLIIKLHPDSEQLDEVMVVAFGSQKKASFTGSAAVVSSKDLANHVTTNVANALVGKIPGLQMRGGTGAPGSAGGSMNIRGISTLYAGSSPLIIVDGAPYSSSLSNIPQGDIESVTVLKDASSAALYGARGASGVILVTTKSGSAKDAIINIDAKWGVNTRAIQEYDKIEDPGLFYETYYAQLYNFASTYRNQQGNLIFDKPEKANSWANKKLIEFLKYNVYELPEGENLIGLDGKLNPKATLGRTYTHEGQTYYLTPDDWSREAYGPALRQEYNVSLSGGSSKNTFYASVGYLNDNGVLQFSGYERLTTRLRADYHARKWLKIGANIAYNHSTTKSNPNLDDSLGATNVLYFTSSIPSIYPLYVRTIGADGKPIILKDINGNPLYDFGLEYKGLGQRPFGAPGNPLGANRYNNTTTRSSQLNANGNILLTITDYLSLNATSTVIWGNTLFSHYDNPFFGPRAGINGQLEKSTLENIRQNHVQTLNFDKSFGSHNLKALLGHEYYRTERRKLQGVGQGGFSPEIQELDAFAKKASNGSNLSRYNVEGFFFNLQYDFSGKYFASMSFRRDASSRFHKNHRWGNFWSLGGGWIISKEDFMSSAKWIDILKLKASIGQQGNDNIGDFAFVDLYRLNPATEKDMAPSFSNLGNPNITWETATNVNVGAEFSFFNSRLSGALDLYTKKTSNLLFWSSLPESGGVRGLWDNIGDIRNTGVELSLNGAIIKTSLIDWNINFNIAHNRTKILSLPESKTKLLGGFYEDRNWFEVGGELYNRMTYAYAGVNEKGEALYYYDAALHEKVDGKIINKINVPGKEKSGTTTDHTLATRYAHGSTLPKAFGGFGTTLKIGAFDASLQFDYQIGGKLYDYQYANLVSPASQKPSTISAIHKDVLSSWRSDNQNSNIPRWQYGDKYTAAESDRFLVNASYLNFQAFTLGYTLPSKIIKGITGIRLYAAGENLIFWSARKGLDPRFSFNETETVGSYSPVRSISGGIQLTF
ncbi:SusC/RagA family TonB-linked outer membrane protein [Porphyromonas cangingivalis]|uniref:TonB-linked outer membrane protein, SusC/RagA family n=1 Tax=Porphyromonas cangingivalis TaxID=36874 RepID=A0A1T4NZC0_PORCN|nr:SusC/RagA family TonB-linked outer membrane protein [Porphyromonas cangingivalis]SJZ84541.1 TonB-linked outer membrane protein, SusC/RagA family [Porphyromonas cangingivalis]SPY36100.1 Outer membrane cobalamin receptor protein [Porphyromonas cangingivalis]VEJ04762.1 Outer membrane cobalamin receptor protein [Porphyromonas cangingivalis]